MKIKKVILCACTVLLFGSIASTKTEAAEMNTTEKVQTVETQSVSSQDQFTQDKLSDNAIEATVEVKEGSEDADNNVLIDKSKEQDSKIDEVIKEDVKVDSKCETKVEAEVKPETTLKVEGQTEAKAEVKEATKKPVVKKPVAKKPVVKKAVAKKPAAKKTVVAKKPAYTKSELRLLSGIIYAEANGQSYAGKLAVAIVVMNRVRNKLFPNTVKGVIYQKSQFGPVRNGSLNRALAEYDKGKFTSKNEKECIAAAKQALSGVKTITYRSHGKTVKKSFQSFHFFSGRLSNPRFTLGGHQFK